MTNREPFMMHCKERIDAVYLYTAVYSFYYLSRLSVT